MSPRPPSTTTSQIVDAALVLLDEVGPDAFTMRAFGAAMGLDPMTIYRYLPNKAAVLQAVVDRLWTQVRPAVDECDDWRGAMGAFARGLRRTMLDHPKLVGLVSAADPSPALLDLVESSLGELSSAGLPPAAAMDLLDCVTAYVQGKVQGEHRHLGSSGAGPFDQVGPKTHPNLVAALSSGYELSPDEQFERGLAALLRGWE